MILYNLHIDGERIFLGGMPMRRGRKQKEEGRGPAIFGVLCLLFIFGSFVGAIFANHMSGQAYTELGTYLSGFLEQIKAEGVTADGAFWECFFKYGKYIAAIWVCGFLAPGAVFIALILVFRGIGYGFTTALFVKQYGVKGILFASLSCLPQNLILVPLYLAMGYISIQFLLNKFRNLPAKARLKREKEKNIMEYTIYAVGAAAVLAAGCLVEVYVAPLFMRL